MWLQGQVFTVLSSRRISDLAAMEVEALGNNTNNGGELYD